MVLHSGEGNRLLRGRRDGRTGGADDQFAGIRDVAAMFAENERLVEFRFPVNGVKLRDGRHDPVKHLAEGYTLPRGFKQRAEN